MMHELLLGHANRIGSAEMKFMKWLIRDDVGVLAANKGVLPLLFKGVNGYGLKAHPKGYKKDDIVLRVPPQCWIQSSGILAIRKAEKNAPTFASRLQYLTNHFKMVNLDKIVALAMMLHFSADDSADTLNSYSYLLYAASTKATPNPLLMDQSYLHELQSSILANDIRNRTAMHLKIYSALFEDQLIPDKKYLWGVSMILSRAVTGGGMPFTLVPYFDMLNHSLTANCKHLFDHLSNSFLVVAQRDIAPGEEICINYGLSSVYRSIRTYGFADFDATSTEDVLTLNIEIKGTAKGLSLKIPIEWNSKSLSPDKNLITAIELITQNQYANERLPILDALSKEIELKINSYETSLCDDIALLGRNSCAESFSWKKLCLKLNKIIYLIFLAMAAVNANIILGEKIDAADIAAPFREEVKEFIKTHLNGVGPKLVGLLANHDPAARKYAEWTGRACAKDGIRYEVRECSAEDLEVQLEKANEDPDVHGIMVYYPVFGGFPSFYGGTMDDYLRDSIRHEKDVEGLCFLYRRNLYRNIRYVDESHTKKCILPCTPLSCIKILEHLQVYDFSLPVGQRLDSKVITIINRSEIVGRPLAAMLANDGAVIFSIDIDSIYEFRRGKLVIVNETAESAIRQSHAIVCGVPSKDYKLNTEWVQPGTAVINVSTFKNVHEEELLKIPGVKYVPMVGKVTVAMLERNLLRLHDNFVADEMMYKKS